MSARTRSRAPIAVRVALIVVAVFALAAAILAGINLYVVTAYNEATQTLSDNMSEATDEATDLEMLRNKQHQLDARFADITALSAIQLPEIRKSVEANADVSRTLTQRIQEEIEHQRNGDDNAPSNQSDSEQDTQSLLDSAGLTDEQRQRIEALLQANQPSTSSNADESESSQDDTDNNSQQDTKPW